MTESCNEESFHSLLGLHSKTERCVDTHISVCTRQGRYSSRALWHVWLPTRWKWSHFIGVKGGKSRGGDISLYRPKDTHCCLISIGWQKRPRPRSSVFLIAHLSRHIAQYFISLAASWWIYTHRHNRLVNIWSYYAFILCCLVHDICISLFLYNACVSFLLICHFAIWLCGFIEHIDASRCKAC